jgi:hypothetical protein
MLGQYDYALRYRGDCKNGRADGKGKAEWLYRFAEMKVKASWEGDFRNGVFLDGQKIKGKVEPVPATGTSSRWARSRAPTAVHQPQPAGWSNGSVQGRADRPASRCHGGRRR